MIPARPHVLLVDDDRDFAGDLANLLGARFEVAMVHEGGGVADLIRAERPDVLLLDIDLGREPDGFAVLEQIQGVQDAPPVIMLTGAHGTDIRAVVRTIKAGAYHYVAKPPHMAELVNIIDHAIANDDLRRQVDVLKEEVEGLRGQMVHADPVSRALLADADRIAATEGSVLITGETGTGKELLARRIHSLSGRAAGPFQDVNCPAVPETLIESEVFGHVRGAYTGADQDRVGKVGLAEKGTLFLDEIGSCGPPFQAKLLRFLEERTYERVGEDRKYNADVRVIAATRVDLHAAMAQGRFRDDLFFRLSGFQIHLPPLRDRPADIMAQAASFLRSASIAQGKIIGGFSAAARGLLEGYDWPGNSRELRNTVERAVVFCDGDEIGIADLQVGHEHLRPALGPWDQAKERVIADLKRRYLPAQLKRVGGDVAKAAEICGLHERTFRKMVRDIGLDPDSASQ